MIFVLPNQENLELCLRRFHCPYLLACIVSSSHMLVSPFPWKNAIVVWQFPLGIFQLLILHHTQWMLPFSGGVGLSLLQFCNLNSFRTKFIMGFAFFMGLSVPQYFNEYTAVASYGPVHTGARWVWSRKPSYTIFFFDSLSFNKLMVCNKLTNLWFCSLTVQWHDKRAIHVKAICRWAGSLHPGQHPPDKGKCGKEGQRQPLVGKVQKLQERREEPRVLLVAVQSEQILPFGLIWTALLYEF